MKTNRKTEDQSFTVKARKNPNIVVKVRPLEQKNKGGAYLLWCVDWTVNGERKRHYHADMNDAQRDAQGVADSLAVHSPEIGELRLDVRTDITTSLRSLRRAGIEKPLAAIMEEYVQAAGYLDGIGSIVEAAKQYAERNRGLRQIHVPDAVAEWIDQEERNKEGRERSAWAHKLRKNVQNRFAADFTGFVGNLDALAIDRWFAGLRNAQDGPHKGAALSETTRRNIRDDLSAFFRWCHTHKYLPKDVDPLEAVPEFQKRERRSTSIILPEDLEKLFSAAPDYLKPYLAVRALAGVRESEANLLDWRHVHLETGWIEITEETAKQTADHEGVARDVPIQPALKAWLARYARKDGPICELTDPLQAIPRLAKRAGVKLPKNALRHSYITYRTAVLGDVPRVADECGNSPEVIRKYYRKRGEQVRLDAPKWFAVYPNPNEPEQAGQ
jgi:integrase